MNINSAKKLLTILDERLDVAKPIGEQLSKIFVPSLLGKNPLVLCDSLHGRLASWKYQSENRRALGRRVNSLVSDALECLKTDRQACKDVSLSTRMALHRFLHVNKDTSSDPQPLGENPELAKLQASYQEQEKLSFEEALRLSILHETHENATEIDKKLFQDLFSSDFDATSEKAVDYFQKFLERHPQFAHENAGLFATLIQEGLSQRQQLNAEDLTERQKALKIAVDIRNLEAGKHKFFCGSYGKHLTSLELFLNVLGTLSQASGGDVLPEPIAGIVKTGKLPDPEVFVRNALRESAKSVSEGMEDCVSLGSSLPDKLFEDPSRKLPEALARHLPHFIAENIESWHKQGWIGNVMEVVPDGPIRDLFLWISQNRNQLNDKVGRDTFIQDVEKKIGDALKQPIAQGMEATTQGISEFIGQARKTIPDFMMKLIGFKGTEFGHLWFDFAKQADGKFTVLVYSSGPAVSCHPKESLGSKIQWPLRISDVDPRRITADFFQRAM